MGVQDRPAAAPQTGPFKSNWKAVNDPTFEQAISACSSIVFAWAGTPAFFQIASEMRVPELYTRSLILCQSVVAITYIVIGVVVYYYCGNFVASPALGSAGPLLKKVCYGLALPGLCVSTLLFVHVSIYLLSTSAIANHPRLLANTSLFVCCGVRIILQTRPSDIGPPGCHAQVLLQSSHTSSQVQFLSLVAWSPL